MADKREIRRMVEARLRDNLDMIRSEKVLKLSSERHRAFNIFRLMSFEDPGWRKAAMEYLGMREGK